jgi:hypothetical protein
MLSATGVPKENAKDRGRYERYRKLRSITSGNAMALRVRHCLGCKLGQGEPDRLAARRGKDDTAERKAPGYAGDNRSGKPAEIGAWPSGANKGRLTPVLVTQ